VLGRDRKAFTQFQTACHDVIDDNDRALVAVVRDAERKKMPVGAANPGAQPRLLLLQSKLRVGQQECSTRSGLAWFSLKHTDLALRIKRTKMIVRAGGGGGDTVTDGYVPTIGRDGLKHRFCVETAKVCGTDRWPPAVKAEL